MTSQVRRGKAPPVYPFTREDPEFRLVDPNTEESSGWTEGDLLIQLAGHLKG